MAVTGPDNFDSDRACDYLKLDVFAPLVEKMRSVLDDPELAQADDPDCDKIVAAVEILAVLCEQIKATIPPATELVEQCRDTFLTEWDAYIDELDPDPGHIEERREVILLTFNRLLKHCRQCDDSSGPRRIN